jgi:ADP-sugar diphosphatase
MTGRLDAINSEIRECVTQLRLADSTNFIQGRAPEIRNNGSNIIYIHGHGIQIIIHESLKLYLTGGAMSRSSEPESNATFFKALLNFEAFRDWCNKFDTAFFSDAEFTEIYILSVQWFGTKIGFLEFRANIKFKNEFIEQYRENVRDRHNGNIAEADIKNPDIPNIIFMRGGSVTVLVQITSDDGMRYGLLVVQPRVAVGRYAMAELPAGMMDDSGTMVGTAAKEMKEETGIEIKESELEDLTQDLGYNAAYTSCGGCDEYMKFFLLKKHMTKEKIEQLKGKWTGSHHEGENIKIKIVPFDRLADHSPDMKTLSALHLYEQHCRRKHAVYDIYGGRVAKVQNTSM